MFLSRDNLIVLGILAVITTTYFAVIYRVQSAKAEGIQARTAEIRRRLEADAMNASQVPLMLRETETMKRRYDSQWDRRLPKRKELAGFLREIASGLSRENLSNQLIQPGKPMRQPLYQRLPITMEFEGSFLALTRFLKRIDEMPRLTRIEHLTVESNEKSENLAMRLGMNIYFTEK